MDAKIEAIASGAKTEKTRCAGTLRNSALARDVKRGMTSAEVCSDGESVVKMKIGYWPRWFEVQLRTNSTAGGRLAVEQEIQISEVGAFSVPAWDFAASAWGSIMFELHGLARKEAQTCSGIAFGVWCVSTT
jgi:hypothetical protein